MIPTTKEWKEARAQALRVIIRKYADIAHEADMIVDEAIAESLPRFVDGSFAALVTQTAARRSINRLKELSMDKDAYDVLRDEAEVAFEATSLDHEAAPEGPEITLEQTRAATIAECQRRLAKAIGGGTPHAEVSQSADKARKILALVDGCAALLQLVNVEQLRAMCAGDGLFRYTDESGADATYGRSHTEAAVLAILAGRWPKMAVGDRPGDVIRTKANAIRMGVLIAAKAS